jgi:hypothetical protein
MASRALGAFLALAAAAAIVVSIASSAWWAGTPVVEGHAIEAKYVHAGPLGATGCNVGGDGSCEPVTIDQTVQLIGYGALGACALATLFLFVVLSAALRVSDHRRGLAAASLLFTVLAGGAGGALLALGPGIEASQHVEVPIGWGAFAFGGGVLASILASLVTRMLEPEPLRLKSSLQHLQQPVDVREALREQHEGLRPAALGPEPKLGTHANPPQRASNPLIEGAPQLRPLYDPQGAGVVPSPHAPTLPTSAPTPLPREAIGAMMGRTPPPSAAAEQVRRMGPSTPALNAHAAQPGSSPRIVAPDDDDGPVNPFARTKSPSDPPPRPSPSRLQASNDPPPRPSQPRLSPSNEPAARPSPSRLSPSSERPNPASTSESMRGKPPSDAPLPGMAPMRGKPPSNAPMRGSPSTDAPLAGMAAMRNKPPSQAPLPGVEPMRNKPPSHAPPPGVEPMRDKPPSQAPGAAQTRSKPPTDAPSRPSPSSVAPPSMPRGTPPADGARGKPPTLSPVRSVVPPPAPGLRGKSIVVPQHLRAGTEQGTPAPAENPPASGSRSGITPPPSLHNKTLAHAVPPMPNLEDGGSRRAQTENDDRLEAAMRETDHITAVEIDHEAKAQAHAAQTNTGANAKQRRSDTDMRTGENAAFRIGEVTAVGLEAAPPAPAFHPGDDEEFNRAGSQAEHTSQTRIPQPPPDPEDLMKTFEQNPKTPIPSLDRRPPQSASEQERRAHVPITTAPTTLPPPKQLDVAPSGPTPACPQCEAPMNWVEEHLRFYCKQCRMYF